MTDRRRYRVIETRRINADTYHLTIDGQLWSEVEWSPSRRAWCVQDAAGRCLTHVESIVGQDRDVETALRLARRIILEGRMPTPEEAEAHRRATLGSTSDLGELIEGDLIGTARPGAKVI